MSGLKLKRTKEKVTYEYEASDEPFDSFMTLELLRTIRNIAGEEKKFESVASAFNEKLIREDLHGVRAITYNIASRAEIGFSIYWKEVVYDSHQENETRQLAVGSGLRIPEGAVIREMDIETDIKGILDPGLVATLLMMVPKEKYG